ncbi:hypothetical protein N2152v2_007538 [Parachlorella kessleri]
MANSWHDSEPITAVALSPDGRLVFSASRSLQQRCWSLETGQPVRSFKGHRAPIADLACDASGGLLASAGADRTVRVWDVDGGFCTHAFTGHSGVVLRVLFHPRQLMVISAGDDAEVRVWDLVTKACIAVLKGHYSAVTSLAISHDGWTLLSGGRDSVVMAWRLKDHTKLATVPVYEGLEGLAVLPHKSSFPGVPADAGKKALCFVTGGEKGRLKVWRADTGACLYEEPAAAAPAASAGNIVELQLLPGGAGVMTATQDCRIQLHTPQGGQLLVARQLIGNNDESEQAQPSNDSSSGGGAQPAPTHLAVSTNSEHVRLFDCATLGCCATLAGHSDIVLSLDALRVPSGQTLLASGSKDNCVRVWAVPQGSCIGLGEGHVGAVGAVAFARRGGSFLVTGGADKLLKVWDLSRLDFAASKPAKLKVTAAVAAHDKDINAVAVSPNDAVICSGSQDRTIKVWKMPNLVLSATLRGHKRGVWAIAFSPVDQVVASASGDKTVRLWSLADGSCLRTFEGHLSSVLRVAFLSAGTQLLSSGADGLVKLWGVRTAECAATFDAHQDKVWALAVGGAGEGVVATGGGDGAVALWEDCTAADEADAAREAQEAVLREQDLLNALQDDDFERAAALAFEMRQPGRLLTVLKKAFDRGPEESQRILARLANGMGPDDLRQCMEFCREWNTSAKTSYAAQAMLHAILQHHPPQELLAVPGLHTLLEALVPYTQRHFSRADRLLRSTYLVDYVLGAMNVLSPEEEEDPAALQPNGHVSDGPMNMLEG